MHSFAHHTARHRPWKTLAIHQARCWQRGRWPQAKMHINIKHRRRAMTPSTRTVKANKRRTEGRTEKKNSGLKTFLELYSCVCVECGFLAWQTLRDPFTERVGGMYSILIYSPPFVIFIKTDGQYTDKKMHTWDNFTIYACLSKLQRSLPAIAAFLLAVLYLIAGLLSHDQRFQNNGRLSSETVRNGSVQWPFTPWRMNCCWGWGRPRSLWPSTDSRSVNLLVAPSSRRLSFQRKEEQLIRSRVECFHPPRLTLVNPSHMFKGKSAALLSVRIRWWWLHLL